MPRSLGEKLRLDLGEAAVDCWLLHLNSSTFPFHYAFRRIHWVVRQETEAAGAGDMLDNSASDSMHCDSNHQHPTRVL